MRLFLKFIAYGLVVIAFSSARAGSYEDFFQAIMRDRAPVVATLLQRGFDANTLNEKGEHGLFIALREGSLKVADVLVKWPKTNVEWRNGVDESPLMMASLHGRMDMVRKLVARDADVNKTGWTPLHYAATNGHLDVMAFLLEHHAFVDSESPNKTTPLMMAAHYGSIEAVKLLLDEGADPTLKNELGLTAIDFANRTQRRDVVELVNAAMRRSASSPSTVQPPTATTPGSVKPPVPAQPQPTGRW
ncbi:ankyrin repeat domain-containing protein [Ramlibacter sp.]|uniref:ankyrin repeat domain-containing protein n=1 Tax=Ramlibacter sp. TaxID=1917967 RepID=UPI003D1451DB